MRRERLGNQIACAARSETVPGTASRFGISGASQSKPKKNIGEIDSSLACTQYKIELKVRNHNSISRQTIIDTIVSCVPSEWSVNLCDAEVFILVEVFKVYKKDVPEATV